MPTFSAMWTGVEDGELHTPVRVAAAAVDGSDGDSQEVSMGRGRGSGNSSGKGRGSGSDGDHVDRSRASREDGTSRTLHFELSGGSAAGSADQSLRSSRSSDDSWWSSQGNENWSWSGGNRWDTHYSRGNYSNWEWVAPPDPWARWYGTLDDRDGHDQGRRERSGARERNEPAAQGGEVWRGHARDLRLADGEDRRQGDASPTSPAAARDVSGALPSGTMPSAGESKEVPAVGDRKGKVSSSYPPIFRAKPGESYKEWRRSVDFWLGGEGTAIPPELIGPRIMVQLRDRAGQLVHRLNNSDVNKANGMEVIMAELEKSPIIRQLDRHKVDLRRKKLMQLRRYANESMESYITRGSIYKVQLQALDKAMEMGEFFYTGLLLDGARITRKDRVMIKTRAGSDAEEDITNAMIELSAELEGESGCPIGVSEPTAAARQGDEFLVQRGAGDGVPNRFVKKEVHAVEAEGPLWDDLESVAEETALEEESDFPPEVVNATNEAYAMHFKARQKIAEVKKLRQYFRRPETAEERKKAIAEKMKTSPCHKCGELGHWSKECPLRGHATGATSWRSATRSTTSTSAPSAADDWSAFVALCQHGAEDMHPKPSAKYKGALTVGKVLTSSNPRNQRHVGVIPKNVFWCRHELKLKVILDLGCVKSVVGLTWMSELVKEWKIHHRWFRVFPEEEQFQFGNMQTLKSKYNVHFEAILAGTHVVLSMSVVPGDCPPLLSRHACSQFGMSIDCGKHAMSSCKMKVKSFGLTQATNGHYVMSLDDFAGMEVSDIPDDFRVPHGMEAFVYAPQSDAPADRKPVAGCAVGNVEPGSVTVDGLSLVGVCGEQGEGQGQVGVPTMRGTGPSCAGVPTTSSGDRKRGRDGGRSQSIGSPTEEAQWEAWSLLAQAGSDPGRGQPSGFRRVGAGDSARVESRGAQPDPEEEGEESCLESQDSRDQGLDRDVGDVPQPVPRMVLGGSAEHGVFPGLSNADISMEEISLATSSEDGGREDSGSRSEVEEEPPVVGEPVGQRSRRFVGPFRGSPPEAQRSFCASFDVRPQRGLQQKFKVAVAEGLRKMRSLSAAAQKEDRFVVFEIYAGTARLTKMANDARRRRWVALEPIDILLGHDLRSKAVQEEVMSIIREEEPELVTLAMPCGPWCQWMYLCDPDEVAAKREQDMPLWRFARKVWDYQTEHKRLVMTEQPFGSEGLHLTFMQTRPNLHRAKVAQCMFGSKDVESGKPHRKLTALDCNDEYMAMCLERNATCAHRPHEHQVLEGRVWWEGRWVNRSLLAAAWPEPLCAHILDSAEETLLQVKLKPHLALHAECCPDEGWETVPVSSGTVPEEELRRSMGELGVAADRYGFISFEGAGQQAPRRIRSAVAHLHVTLGHVANERLVRMLTLAGAGQQITTAAANLRCQVCAMVHPPQDAPQVSGSRPMQFNEKVSGDTFYVWDSADQKFAITHFVDGLTDYHIADCNVNADSMSSALLLRNQWYGIFGTPDLLLTDGGPEFAGSMETLNQLMGVVHEIVPEGAKWRLGHAERHGAIMKLMMMKMIKAHNLKGLLDIKLATAAVCIAKNRLANRAGVSPLQAVTGRNNVLPASLMNQICSGKMRYVMNQEISQDASLQRAERIRAAAVEAFLWLDSHEVLRKALASKSRPPKLEMIREGATVYIYDPPSNRKGLARRLQDNSSWSGPGTVVCVEKDRQVPSKVWIRLRGRVRGVPLERVRLATVDELVSGHYITEALEEVQKDLTSGRLRVTDEGGSQVVDEDDDEGAEGSAQEEEKETEQMRLQRRLLMDVPLQFLRQPDPQAEPSSLPFGRKRELFDNLAKGLEAPTALQEAQVRGRLEEGYAKARKVKDDLDEHRRREARKLKKDEKKRKAQEGGGGASSSKGPRKEDDDQALVMDLHLAADELPAPGAPN
eukprot:Skav216248  [mRNA]  locus=scaffold20:99205:112201:+ [translate_table: standard]